METILISILLTLLAVGGIIGIAAAVALVRAPERK
jgi:hypothetical protein